MYLFPHSPNSNWDATGNVDSLLTCSLFFHSPFSILFERVFFSGSLSLSLSLFLSLSFFSCFVCVCVCVCVCVYECVFVSFVLLRLFAAWLTNGLSAVAFLLNCHFPAGHYLIPRYANEQAFVNHVPPPPFSFLPSLPSSLLLSFPISSLPSSPSSNSHRSCGGQLKPNYRLLIGRPSAVNRTAIAIHDGAVWPHSPLTTAAGEPRRHTGTRTPLTPTIAFISDGQIGGGCSH